VEPQGITTANVLTGRAKQERGYLIAYGICVDRTLQTPQQILPSNACFGSQPRCTQRILSGESLGELLSKG
jgi:hypothetical protein